MQVLLPLSLLAEKRCYYYEQDVFSVRRGQMLHLLLFHLNPYFIQY